MTDQDNQKDIDEKLDLGLTDEESVFLKQIEEKIQKKYKEILESERTNNVQKMQESIDQDPNFLEDPIHKRKLTDFPREIRIQIIGEVASSNEKGQLTSIEPLVNGYYHLPVPAQTNIQDSIDKLRNILEPSIKDLAAEVSAGDLDHESK